MTSAVEKHEQLLAEGWRTRQDGLMWPPADWPDQRARTPAAAWHEHVANSIEAAVDWHDPQDVA